MAKLSEKFKLGGGESTAPVSVNQSNKLSDRFTINPVNAPAYQRPATPVAQTEIPKIEQPSYDYQSVIDEYESLPNTNIFNRIFSQESRDAYKRKQELAPEYEKAKDVQTASKLKSLNALDEVNKLWDDYEGHDDVYAPLYELLKSKGVTDQKELKELVNDIEATQKRQGLERASQYLPEFADKHPVVGTLATFPMKMVTDVGGAIENPINYLTGKPLTNTSASNAGTKVVQEMRGKVSEDMSDVGKFAYGIGTSIGDMAPIIALGGGAGLAYAGAAAAQGSIPELIDRGLTPNQIIFTAMANGAAEVALEKLPLGNLEKWAEQPIEKSFKSIAKVIGSQMANEGIEESGTDIANTIFDALINGDKAELNQSIQEKGFWPAVWDYVKQVGYDGLAGAVSGGIMGGGAAGVNVVRNGFYNPDSKIPKIEQTETKQAEIPTVNSQLTNSNDKAYNQNTTTEVEKGAPNVGRETSEGYDGRGSERISGELPETERPRPDMVDTGDVKGLNPASGGSSSTSLLGYDNKVFGEDMDVDPSVSSFDFRYSNNNVQDFHDSFEAAKASNDHGEAVDSHDTKTLQEIVDNGGSLYMSADKTVLGAVTGDGNLTSVVKAKDSPHKAAAMNVAKAAVKLGAKKGDCFGRPLVNMYARAGFVPVARIEYSYRINDAMDAQVREQLANKEINKEPDVYALMYDPNADTNKVWSMDELNSLPLYEGASAYDDMLAYRDSLLDGANAQTKVENGNQNEIQTLEAPEKPASKEIQTLEKPKRNKVMYEDIGLNNSTTEDYGDNEGGGSITLEIPMEGGVPTRTDENGTTSQVATNSYYKYFQYDKEGLDHLIANIEDGRYQKQVKSMQKTYENSIDQIAKYGADAKYDDLMQKGIETDDDLALAHNLLTYYYKEGDMEKVDMLLLKTQQSGTEIGRALHFFKIFGDSPLGVQQATAKLSGSIAKQFVNEAEKNPRGKKAKQVEKVKKVTNDIVEKVREVKERKKKSSQLAKTLRYNVEQKMKQEIRKGSAPKTFDMILEEVNNTLEDEYASVKFSDDAKRFFATMIQDDVKVEIIADEIDHYMKHGSFYPLEQEKSVPKPTSKKLDSILAQMGNDTVVEKDAVQTFEQIREEVKNSLEREMASIDFTDAETSYLARMIEYGSTNEEITNAIVQKLATGYMTMSAEDIEKITQLYDQADHAKTSKESVELKKQAAAIGAKYLGDASFMDKWNAWRYMAMLGNPKTILRNIFGNSLFGAVTDVKDAVGALIESKMVKKGERTKAILNPKTDKALIDACARDFDEVSYEEATKGGHKYNMQSAIESERQIFKSKLLEKGRNLTNDTLENSDIKALRKKYKKALAGYLKANGYDASILKTESAEATKAREYAIKQAKEATFHEDNALAEVLSKASHNLRERGDAIGKVGEVAIESLAPFKKTPANILKEGIEYSPAGLIKFFNQVRTKADLNARIDTLSKTFTGTTILAIGAWLASKGLLVGKRGDDEDPFQKGSDYALKIGDHTFTIDWMAPAALPLFVGAELYKVFNPNESADEAKNFFETFVSLADPVLEMSMLQGLNNMLNALANARKNTLGSTVTNIASGYVSQSIPTLAGQVARTIDPYRRTTRTNTSSYTNPAVAIAEKAGLKAVNKIPFLSMANEKYVNAWGEPQENNGGNILGRALQNFVLPGYWNDTSLTPREEKLAKLEKTYTGNGSLIPSLAENNRPTGGRLTNKEYTKWAQTRGNEMKSAVDAALAYSGKLTEKDLQAYIHDIENFANNIAKQKQFGTEIPTTYKKAYEAYINGGRSYKAVMEYYISKKK